MKCQNNLKQIGLALHNYEGSQGVFPPGGVFSNVTAIDSWSVQARLLPFVEQDNLQRLINFGVSYTSQGAVTEFRVPIFVCPSEINDRKRPDGAINHYPLNYGINMGTWFVFNPVTGQGGDGAFMPGFSISGTIRATDFTDGMSNTLGVAEVKAYTPYLRDGGSPAGMGIPVPTSPATVAGYGGSFKTDSGHTEWVDARTHQTGFTTVFTPNTKVPYSAAGVNYDIDFNSSREGKTINQVTYAAVTSRSYHTGVVNAMLMDGSVRSIRDSITIDTWRAIGSRNGNEVVSDF